MRKQLFPLLIALSALAVSGSAAFYSVYGLSKLFAGASFSHDHGGFIRIR